MTVERVVELQGMGYNCAQIVYLSAAEAVGIDEKTALRNAACFGGGMFKGEVCGAVTGGLMAIGQKFGHCTPNDADGKALAKEKACEFEQKFMDKYSTLLCKDILSYDFSNPAQEAEARESGKTKATCPYVIAYATEILKDIV